jgi:uncharacterized RDD family membrane protein YckC
MEDYQDRLRIATPEGVTLDLVLAGIGSRFVASLADVTLKGLLIGAAWLAAALLLANDLGLALATIASFLIYFGYDVAFEVFANGRTPGKRWSGLRVLRDDGRPVDPLSSCIRNVIRLVDGLPLLYVPGVVSIFVTERNQRLGDLAARTIVVRDAPRPKDDKKITTTNNDIGASQAPLPASFANGWAMPAGAARPRAETTTAATLDVSAITPDDLVAIRQFLDRRADLPDPARADIARRMSAALRPRVGGATGHLRDERLLEAVAAAKSRERTH